MDGGINMTVRRKWKSRLSGAADRKAFILHTLLFLAVLVLCAFYFRLTVSPMASYDISPGNVPERWHFSSSDGTEIMPEDNRLPIDGENGVVVCETQINDNVSEKSLLVVNATSSDCVFYVDGQLLFSPSGRYEGGQFSAAAYERSGASGQFVMNIPSGETPTLTMIVQFQGTENRLSRLPRLTLYPEVINYLSQYVGPAAGEALPAGICFMAFLFVMGLFLIGLWKGKKDYGLILIAICLLAKAVRYTASYALNAVVAFQSPTIIWFCTAFPQVAVCWILWYRLTRKRKMWILPILGLETGAVVFFLIAGFHNLNWTVQMNAMTIWILPAGMLAVLIAMIWDAVAGNRWFRRFFLHLACAAPVVMAGWAFSLLTGGSFHHSLQTAFSQIFDPNHSFFQLSDLLCSLFLILCFLQAALDLIGVMAQQDAEMQALSLREKYAVENLEIMKQSREETRRQQHELRHHMLALEEMLSQNRSDRAMDYVRSLQEKITSMPTGKYSDNLVMNAVAGHYLNQAKAEGIRVETGIRAEKILPLKDADLCVLLTNILENALEACHKVPEQQDRFIRLKIEADREHLFLTCDNSTDASTVLSQDDQIHSSKNDPQQHGYGIPAIRHIVDEYCGILKISSKDGCFTVEVSV